MAPNRNTINCKYYYGIRSKNARRCVQILTRSCF